MITHLLQEMAIFDKMITLLFQENTIKPAD